MSLLVHLGNLSRHPAHLCGELDVEELGAGETAQDLVRVDTPLRYALEVQAQAAAILVTGRLETEVFCECARCLKAFRRRIVVEGWSVLLPLEGEDRVAVVNDAVDLTPYVREDTLLALPQHPLCDPGCGGLSAAPPPEVKVPDTASQQPGGVSVWAALERLKF
ncbi:MAG: YceD family protein [Verrucomicrobia bacterium]|nr:YceD family protein [Verrucomicrobiota bacterium]